MSAPITDPPTCPECHARKPTNFSHYDRCLECGFKPWQIVNDSKVRPTHWQIVNALLVDARIEFDTPDGNTVALTKSPVCLHFDELGMLRRVSIQGKVKR